MHKVDNVNAGMRSVDVVQSYKGSGSSCEEIQRQSSVASVKDYVESLHQNSKSTLLYGKNNVIVQPVSFFHVSDTSTLSKLMKQ